jgi:hypothetical protein
MKLENALFELTTLVDYGTYYLKNRTVKDLTLEQAFGEFDGEDIINYMLHEGWDRWMLEQIGSYDIKKYIENECDIDDIFDTDDILQSVDSYDIKQYVKDNFDADDVYDSSDMLDCLSEDTIRDYVTQVYDVADWVSWNG